MNVTDIKDRSPNLDLVASLEELLEQAKSGELRSLFSVMAWDDDSVTWAWNHDTRNSLIRIIGAVALLNHDLQFTYAASDETSATNQVLTE
jgi:hypothetical protein